MKSIISVTMLIMLFSLYSCSKTEKASPQNVVNNDINIVYLDESSEKYRELLVVLDSKYENWILWRYHESLENDFRKYYSLGLGYYKNNEYEQAIDNFISAVKKVTFIIAYYQLGLCLVDIGGYENAIKAFEKAATVSPGFYRPVEELYTFDTNGERREDYFAYYNIACIMSLQNNITGSFDYLCEAIYNGYPYINHIKTDTDLGNLFAYNNGFYLKETERIFNAGSDNTVAGKGFKLAWGGAPVEYYFIDDTRFLNYTGGLAGDSSGWLEGTYEAKNYLLLMRDIKFHYEENVREKEMNIRIKMFESENGYAEIPVDNHIGRFPNGY